MRTIQDLSNEEKCKILFESNRRCYVDIAEDYDLPLNTVKRVVRENKTRMKRYCLSGRNQETIRIKKSTPISDITVNR
jgi:hypothetical protein